MIGLLHWLRVLAGLVLLLLALPLPCLAGPGSACAGWAAVRWSAWS
ncbi:hypothetical protein ACFQU7_41690 [Pseudoroseomonas wenyumeiae]